MIKNLIFLNDILLSVKDLLNIIVIFEIKFLDSNLLDILILGYLFLGVNFKIFVGGVGLYVLEKINFKCRNDLDFGLFEGFENCWIEIERKK